MRPQPTVNPAVTITGIVRHFTPCAQMALTSISYMKDTPEQPTAPLATNEHMRAKVRSAMEKLNS